jgi:uncharacterized protein RhaS with RHS repeats
MDPIGLAGGLNVYGYANGDPINFSDPFGLCPTCEEGEDPEIVELTFPGVVPAARAVRAGAAAVRGGRIMLQARRILGSSEMATLRSAAQAGESATVTIGGRLVQYEHGLAHSGMTLHGSNGFVLGRQAFSSGEELTKTVLHELFRLTTSSTRGGGAASGTIATAETAAAAGFADSAYSIGLLLRLWP